jgi:hypothetical protein
MPSIRPIVSFDKEAFSSNRVRARVLNELKAQAYTAKVLLNMTTEYWNDPPTFTEKIYYRNASPVLFIGPDYYQGSFSGAEHWTEVNDGTSIRYVVMSQGFVPKTLYPGAIGGNVAGEGGAAYIDPNGRPGIRARHWDELIQGQMRHGFTRGIQNAIKKGLEKK